MTGTARYQRHTLIDWFSQAEVAGARIGVVGAGAVGNEALKCLALLGVGALDIYDFDRIEVHNLTRSVLFREADVGRNKAECAAARLREIDANIAVTAYAGDFFKTLDFANLPKYAAMICCVDNFEARIKLNLICKLWGVNFINTGVDSRHAVVDTFPFAQNADAGCYECALPPTVYQRLSQRYSCGGLKRIAFVEKRIPTTVITASLAGSLAASKALRLGPASADHQAGRVFVDSIAGSSTRTELSARADCPVCSQFKAPVRMTCVSSNLQAELEKLDSDITLPEPLILSFKCKLCGLGEGHDAPLFWRASDHDSRLADCAGCGAEGAVDIQIRDRIPAKTLALIGTRPLPLPFVVAASETGTCVFVLARES
jgi:molybdopterin/thiamine biosynthesis adenylyltransferase